MGALVFYSDQDIPTSEKVDQALVDLLAKPHPVMGYIPSSSDPPRKFFNRCRDYYARLGIHLEVYFELDVDYQPERLADLLACDAIHLSGGDTYHFLHWLRQRGMLQPLRDYVQRGGVLVGVSAGSILMTPEITTADLCGDVPLYPGQDASALALVDFAFVPHIDDMPLPALEDYSREHQVMLYGCPDAAGIIVRDGQPIVIGEVIRIVSGEGKPIPS